ncbi:hypothetical protein JT27_09745 [Alcaligenes faecalis]|nr:hypothetical protein C660_08949 [Alcaligenes sp. HPC1271]KGP01505.1 hypothetical protein JT27_09745 [Alcaligenes faecalis]
MLAACTATGNSAQTSSTSSFSDSSGGLCNADALNPAGQTASQSQVERLVKQAGAAKARVLAPDRMYTTDYDPTRLNIRVDEQNKITSVYCG